MAETMKSPATKKSQTDANGKEVAEILEGRIWNNLPEDLFEPVMARLPIPDIFLSRAVSKKWYSFPYTRSFSQQFDEAHPAPWFYTVACGNDRTGAMYDSCLKEWYIPKDPLMKEKVMFPLCSLGGLVCFLGEADQNLCVVNPLTRSFRELPSKLVGVWSLVAMGMTQDRDSAGYKVLMLGCNGDHEIYDSGTNTWSSPESLPSTVKVPFSFDYRSQSASIGETLYFLCMNPEGVLSYDMGRGIWKHYIIPLPENLIDCTLAVSGEKILLVGLQINSVAMYVVAWVLQVKTLSWKEVNKIPIKYCLELHGKYARIICLDNQGLMLLSLGSQERYRLVTCDTSTGEWQEVPWCVVQPDRRRCRWIACGVAFNPSVTALA